MCLDHGILGTAERGPVSSQNSKPADDGPSSSSPLTLGRERLFGVHAQAGLPSFEACFPCSVGRPYGLLRVAWP